MVDKMIQNLNASVTGNVVKAVLCIRAVDKLGAVKALGGGQLQNKNEQVKSAIDDVVKLNEDLVKRAEKSLNGGKSATYKDIKGAAEKNGYIALEVQYNPSTLRLSSSAGKQYSYSGSGAATQMQTVQMPASTTLSCDLLFDDTNVQDAFMLDSNPVTNASVGNIYSAAKSAVKGKYSVQRQMEGILSLLTVAQAKHVVFFWGSMCFRGEITEVTTAYSMFNKKGYPTRGILSLSIRQSGVDTQRQGDLKYDDSYWMKKYETAFTESRNRGSAFKKATNNNLLNLKL